MKESTEPSEDAHLRLLLEVPTDKERLGAQHARKKIPRVPEELESFSPGQVRQLFSDLCVLQSETEIQNEELRRAQEELEASRARYFDLYDLAPVGYLTLTETGFILEANFTAARLLGLPKGALVNKPLTRFIVPDDQDVYYRHRKQRVTAGALNQACELRLLRSDADAFWARLETSGARDANGAAICRVVVSDISEHKRDQETLRESEVRHRTLFQSAPEALMTLAPPTWKFTAGNAATLAMFGAEDEADFMLRTPSDYSPDRQSGGGVSTEKFAAMIEMAMAEGSRSFAWTYQRPSKAQFEATVLLTRIEVDGQSLLQAMVRDETEARRRQAMTSQTDRLASMGFLAAGVAHEINNPLAYVLFNADALAQELPKIADAAARCRSALRDCVGDSEFAARVGENAEMLESRALIDAVERAREALDGANRIKKIAKARGTFSRADEIGQSRVDVGYAMECAITMASEEIGYTAKLVKELEVVPPVWASEAELSQVFLNLLINASHAIGEGNLERDRIKVRIWAEDGAVFIGVEDTGEGIAEEHLGSVFAPFATNSLGVGSGLELSICKNIIGDLGGDIRVESEVGKGTRFIVRLPALADAVDVPVEKTSIIPPSEALAARGRILVVDDEQPIRMMMVRLLGRDHDVVTASSGKDARGLLEKDQGFDLILCDVMMPEMNGMDLHAWLAAHAPDLGAKMVFMTGGVFTPKATEYLKSIDNPTLEKPFDTLRLKRLVSRRIAAAKK